VPLSSVAPGGPAAQGLHARRPASVTASVTEIFRRLGHASMTAGTLERLGDTHHEAGHAEAARGAWTWALDIRTKFAVR